ncbi:MAG TPA: hypothetical protein EYP21_06520 [Syntrophaceae bacterium]|nr:hypothetical protein [Syntrophaceae bacterium]
MNFKSTIIEYRVYDQNFKRLVNQVLGRIPDTYEEEFPIFSIYEGYCEWGAMVDEQGIVFDVGKLNEESEGDNVAIKGLVAHELAHVFLKHSVLVAQGKATLEHEADKLAIKWDFKREIEVFRQKFGPPTPQK